MTQRGLAFSLSCLLFAALSLPSWATSEGSCPCNDGPSQPCLLLESTLQGIDFELRTVNAISNNAAHTALCEASDSEVWVLIETVPSGPCKACAQTYVLYAPERDVKSNRTYSLFAPDDPKLTASRTVLLMTECMAASSLSIRMAIIEEDDAYSDSLACLAPFLAGGLLFSETGSRAASAAEATGWSARLDGPWLDSLFARLTLDADNDVVLPPTAASTIPVDGSVSTTIVGEKYGLLPRWVTIRLLVDAYVLPDCLLRCDEGDAPTQAETHLSGRKLCELGSLAATARPGFTEVTASSSLPAGAAKQSTSVKRETFTRSDGSKVELVFIVRVLEFAPDGSIYVEVYSTKRVIAKDGTVVETVRDCLQSTSLRGFDRSRIRSLLEVAQQTGVVHTISGGSPLAPLSLSTPIDTVCGAAATPDHLIIVVPSGTTLDASELAGTAAVAQAPSLLAWQSVTIHADEIALPEGLSLASAVWPTPQRSAAVNALAVWAPDAASIDATGDRLDIVVANQSGAPAVVSLSLVDDRGWVVPETRDLFLAPGQASVVTIFVTPGPSEAAGATSGLSLAATAEGLTPIAGTVELRSVALEGTGAQSSSGQTSASVDVPQDISVAARTLAWKGGYLGRTDAAQRWDADEHSPGQFCEPCGHTPMCAVCMEWDLGEWQLHRQKTMADALSLMSVLAYLAEARGTAAYDAVAAVYWDGHWDGWHNRDRPW